MPHLLLLVQRLPPLVAQQHIEHLRGRGSAQLGIGASHFICWLDEEAVPVDQAQPL